MNPDPRFQEALEDSLSETGWQELLANPVLRTALAEQICIDCALRTALESKDIVRSLEDSIVASTKTVSAGRLADRIVASTQMQAPQRRPLPQRWSYVRPLAAAAVFILGCIALAWSIHERGSHAVDAPVVKSQPATHPLLVAEAVPPPKTVPVEPSFVNAAASKTEHLVAQAVPSAIVSPVPEPPKAPLPVVAAKPSTPAEKPQALAITLPKDDEKVDFEKHILPVLERSCFECHSGKLKKPKGDLRLDDLASIRAKSKTDNVIFPHKPERSTLLKSITLASSDDNAMPPSGKGKPLSPEETAVIKRWIDEGANFGGWTSTRAQTLVVHTRDEPVDATNVRVVARRIDELIAADLKQHGEPPFTPSDDHTFVRRVYLDLIGRIPSFTELQQFVDDKSTDKRAKLVDALLTSNGYTSRMFNFWAGLLRARDELADKIDGKPYLAYIKQSIRDNKPFDVWARQMLSPEGFGWKAPATGYYLRDGANRPANIEATASLFLGTQISCAQCHDHPYDQWTRMDYHQFLAFTSGIKASNDDGDVGTVNKADIKAMESRYKRLKEFVYDPARRAKYDALAKKLQTLQATAGGAGVVNGDSVTAVLPADYQYKDAPPGSSIEPKVLYGDGADAHAERPADALAQWVASPRNPRFNLALANRMWDLLFGAPFAGNPEQIKEIADCDNPDLAAYLANVVRDSHYDLRQILRIFANTQAYQARAHPEPQTGEPYRFAGPVVRRLSAEQVWDSMMTLAVKDLDNHLTFEARDVAKTDEASKAGNTSDLNRIVRQMVDEDERAAKADSQKSRKLGKAASEFVGGEWLRASELPQPAPPSHFLRTFGQGDRDFIDDSWSLATVPQSLLMLNSQFFERLSPDSPLTRSLRTAGGSREVVRRAFLAVLSREPTKGEINAALETLGANGSAKDLAKALLTTAEFAFQK